MGLDAIQNKIIEENILLGGERSQTVKDQSIAHCKRERERKRDADAVDHLSSKFGTTSNASLSVPHTRCLDSMSTELTDSP
jgi:hypothetical protein